MNAGSSLLEVPNVKEMFERASHILGYDLLNVCLDGDEAMLRKTKYQVSKRWKDYFRWIFCLKLSSYFQQPAVVVTSLATVEALYQKDPSIIESCIATAGFSVGEITSVIFSGALSFEEGNSKSVFLSMNRTLFFGSSSFPGLKLLKTRAEAMQFCSEKEDSGMMTLFFGKDKQIGMAKGSGPC